MKKPFFLILWLVAIAAFAQPTERFTKVIVAPDRFDWQYHVGEPVKFTISVLQNGNLVKNAKITYQIGPEKLESAKQTMTLSTGTTTLDGGTMKTGGFLRCLVYADVDGKEYKALGTAGFDPTTITPTVQNPADFDAFWNNAKADLAKIPLDAKTTLLPERCTEKTNVYHVNFQNFRAGARVYGILCVPKKEGKYPAILHVPGAGARPYNGDITNADKGFVTLQIGIHGIPVTMETAVYNEMMAGILSGYWGLNIDDKDRFFYKRVYMGCVRSIDFIFSLPQFDGSNLAVTGGSQGGALSIVTAALDARVKYLGVFYPALADVTGYLNGRAGGWPHYFDKNGIAFFNKKEKLETVGYYDVVNFARRVKVPGFYSWGFNDETCPPTSMYAAYNTIAAPKELFLALETGHWTYPEQQEKMTNWLVEKLRGK